MLTREDVWIRAILTPSQAALREARAQSHVRRVCWAFWLNRMAFVRRCLMLELRSWRLHWKYHTRSHMDALYREAHVQRCEQYRNQWVQASIEAERAREGVA